MSDGLTYITRYSAPDRSTAPRRKKGGALFVVLAILFLGLGGYQIWKSNTTPVGSTPVIEEILTETVATEETLPEDDQDLADDLWFLSQSDTDIGVDIEATETTFSSIVPETAEGANSLEDSPLQINPPSEPANP